jgi:hypothetical protein
MFDPLSVAGLIVALFFIGATLSLTDQGHYEMMDWFFTNGAHGGDTITDFRGSLWNDTAVGTDDESDLTGEQTGTGYSRQAILRDASANGWPTLALDSSEMQIISKQVTFTATAADWIATTCIALIVNMGTDRLVAYSNIASVTLANTESLAATFKIKLTKV